MSLRPPSTKRRTLSTRLAALVAAVAVVLPPHVAALSVRAAPFVESGDAGGPLVRVRHGAFMLGGQPMPYLHGINYEGPSDRPWRMWQDGLFDPTLIAHDLDMMAAAGYNPVRVFVQRPLPDEILAGDYARLDTLVSLAAARGLRLLVTFNDDGDGDLRRVARVEGLVAARLAGNSAIFGYDLRNEPNLSDIAGSTYPAGVTLPLLSPGLAAAYPHVLTASIAHAAGLRPNLSMSVNSRRRGDERGVPGSAGVSPVPGPMMGRANSATSVPRSQIYPHDSRASENAQTVAQALVAGTSTRASGRYLTALRLLDAFLAANPAYPSVPPAPGWSRFLDAANSTLATYLGVQLAAIRAADPAHLVTVGYNSRFWSALPANRALDFRSIHIYPPRDFDGFHAALLRFEALNDLAPTPLVLEEYGVSNDLNGPQSAAVREMATALYLRTLGGGGDMKWMFDDDAVGYNAYENNLGAVDARGVPKPTYLASSAADAYWAGARVAGGLSLQPDPLTGAGFTFVARDGMAIGGSLPYSDARVSYTPSIAGVTWLDWSTPGALRVSSTTGGSITLAMGSLTGAAAVAVPTEATSASTSPATTSTTVTTTAPATTTAPTTATIPTTTTAPVTGALTVTLTLRPGVTTVVRYGGGAVSPPVPVDLPAPYTGTGWYLVARGHNVAPPFLAPWQALGGADGAGLPMTEPFAYNGLVTQYFDDVALRIGPHGPTTAPIGLVAIGAPLPRARPLPASTPHVYDRTTGHNVHGAFLDYWRRAGGVAFWGDPVSEELVEQGRVVQYFDGAEFAMTPFPHAHVILLPLGQRMWPSVRHVYGL